MPPAMAAAMVRNSDDRRIEVLDHVQPPHSQSPKEQRPIISPHTSGGLQILTQQKVGSEPTLASEDDTLVRSSASGSRSNSGQLSQRAWEKSKMIEAGSYTPMADAWHTLYPVTLDFPVPATKFDDWDSFIYARNTRFSQELRKAEAEDVKAVHDLILDLNAEVNIAMNRCKELHACFEFHIKAWWDRNRPDTEPDVSDIEDDWGHECHFQRYLGKRRHVPDAHVSTPVALLIHVMTERRQALDEKRFLLGRNEELEEENRMLRNRLQKFQHPEGIESFQNSRIRPQQDVQKAQQIQQVQQAQQDPEGSNSGPSQRTTAEERGRSTMPTPVAATLLRPPSWEAEHYEGEYPRPLERAAPAVPEPENSQPSKFRKWRKGFFGNKRAV